MEHSRETVWNAGGLLLEKQHGSCMEYSRETVWNAGGLLLEKQQGSCMEYSREAVWNTAGKLYGIQQGCCMEYRQLLRKQLMEKYKSYSLSKNRRFSQEYNRPGGADCERRKPAGLAGCTLLLPPSPALPL